jgi:FAD/FMN-containing dehydrogenase
LSVLSGLVTLHDGHKGLFLQPLLSEESETGEHLFDELCSLPGAKVVARRWSPYKQIFDREAEKAWSANQNYRVSARFCEELNEAVVDLLTQGAERAPIPGCVLLLHDFHGQASRIPIENAAYPLRKVHYLIEVIAGWDSDADGIAAREWLDQVLEELSKLSLPGGYPNVLGPEEKQRSYDFYEPSRARLRAVKAKFDPYNVFSSNVCQL